MIADPAAKSSAPARPEVLAPAGDAESLAAALAAGADAVYFGLDEGFNARARARNFTLDGLAETCARIHRAGARAYLAINTLVFEPELPRVEEVLRAVAASGVDALIVQDPAVCLLARALCPSLELHASTQMTITGPAAARFAADLGVTRVVVPRELSLDEIAAFRAGSALELEVFVHGALCVSWSGQCFTSEAWSGRSANRGQCAQSCRLPYDLVVDGERRELGETKYLLSPRDLAGAPLVPRLAAIGVHGLKIEGRQKGRVYVATAVAAYRRAVDGAAQQDGDLLDMSLAYSRGFSPGFLEGSDHQRLVDGRFPKHRGVLVGTVHKVGRGEVEIDPAPPESGVRALELRPGMGVVFDAGDPEDKREPGGPVFAVAREGERLRLRFGEPGPDLARVRRGQRVWATSDPELMRRADREAKTAPHGRIGVALRVAGRAGEPLLAVAIAAGHEATAESASRLEAARGEGLGVELLREKLGAFGGTPFRFDGLQSIDAAALAPGLHVPVSELKEMRRALIAELDAAVARGPVREVASEPVLERVRESLRRGVRPIATAASATLVPLVRDDAQLDAALAAGIREVELDWMELVGLKSAVEKTRRRGARAVVATLRIQKPLESAFLEAVTRLRPDALLVRGFEAMESLAGSGLPLHGDFSLNVANGLTALHLLGRGLETLTPSHDLDEAQLLALVDAMPADRTTLVLHHRIAAFHTEHCVYAHLLSQGRDHRTCGRPCETSRVALHDPRGLEHPVIVDAGCRNTVFDAQAQGAAHLVPDLLARGVRRFRVEFVRESGAEVASILRAYGELLRGEIGPGAALERAGARARVGVVERSEVLR